MSRKRDSVVLCEGKRDVRLLARFYSRANRSVSIDRFCAENYFASELEDIESNRLHRFTERRNRDDVFLKSEAGIENLKPLFAQLAPMLFHRKEVAVCLVVDLDKKDHNRWEGPAGRDRYHSILSDFDERVDDIHTGDCGVEHTEFHRKTRTMFVGRATFWYDGYAPAPFDVLAFRSSLEDAAGIEDEDDDDEETEKLDQFLRKNGEPFERVL